MRKRLPVVFAYVTALSAIVFAGAPAESEVSGPVSGYLFDSSMNAIRPVLGIPGAASIGEPLELGFEISQAAVGPAQDFIVAAVEGGIRVIRPAARTAVVVETLHGRPSRIVLSPGGSAALLVNDETADVYTGLPGSPALARTLALDSLREVSSWAVSDDGTAVLASGAGAVWLAGESAGWKILGESAQNARIAFAPGSRDAAVAISAGVTLYRDVTGAGEMSRFPSLDKNAAAPEAVAFSADGRILLAAGRAITAIDPADSTRTEWRCDCSPSSLTPMGPVFRLTELSQSPLWLLDPRRGEPPLLFVPATASRLAGAAGDLAK